MLDWRFTYPESTGISSKIRQSYPSRPASEVQYAGTLRYCDFRLGMPTLCFSCFYWMAALHERHLAKTLLVKQNRIHQPFVSFKIHSSARCLLWNSLYFSRLMRFRGKSLVVLSFGSISWHRKSFRGILIPLPYQLHRDLHIHISKFLLIRATDCPSSVHIMLAKL